MAKLFAHAMALCLVLAAGCVPQPAPPPPPPAAPSYPMVGGAVMDPRFTIFENARKSADHRILISVLAGSGLGRTLSSAGAYTLFAPTDMAFRLLPNGTIEALLHPRSRPELVRVAAYHVVPGSKTRSQIMADLQAGGGVASYRTQRGEMLRVTMQAGRVVLVDGNGRRSSVTQADVAHANGVLHVVDAVLLPTQS
ncbi:MAG TPA: fasciclin domain-containing protein [Allosphingosinicella sp.]|nr:fasciclin domain-containing protein [Allosphingosinicella sp.]